MGRVDLVTLVKHRYLGRQMLEDIAREHRAAVRDILGRYREPQFVALRVEFMRRAHAAGMGSITIGKLLRRNHTTVLYHLNGWRERKYAWARARKGAGDVRAG